MQEVVAIDEQENAGHGEPLDGVLQRTDGKSDDDFNFDEQGGVRFPFLLHQLQGFPADFMAWFFEFQRSLWEIFQKIFANHHGSNFCECEHHHRLRS